MILQFRNFRYSSIDRLLYWWIQLNAFESSSDLFNHCKWCCYFEFFFGTLVYWIFNLNLFESCLDLFNHCKWCCNFEFSFKYSTLDRLLYWRIHLNPFESSSDLFDHCKWCFKLTWRDETYMGSSRDPPDLKITLLHYTTFRISFLKFKQITYLRIKPIINT